MNRAPSTSADCLRVLFLNCTVKSSPEVSHVEALWDRAKLAYGAWDCTTEQLRTVDLAIAPGYGADLGLGDAFPQILDRIRRAQIVILGLSIRRGAPSSESQKLLERLASLETDHCDPATGQPLLYNRVLGLLLLDQTGDGSSTAASVAHSFNRLGCISPPGNGVVWSGDTDTDTYYLAVEKGRSATVRRDIQIMVENTVAIATLLQQSPLQTNLKAIAQTAKAEAAAVTPPSKLMYPRAIAISPDANANLNPDDTSGLQYREVVTRRIWTIMEAGIQRGYVIQIMDVEDRVFKVTHGRDPSRGFIYKIYPGLLNFRLGFQPYEQAYEKAQRKSEKLAVMEQCGMPVPINYGIFQSTDDIPLETLKFPLVAKPNYGSLSQNVFTELQTVAQLQHAAREIELSGQSIKLESHIAGRDYRILIVEGRYAGAVERRPASLVGDGQQTILELFQLRNQEPRRGPRYEAHTTLHQLVFDQTSRQLLAQAGYTLDTVLPSGERFYLQTKIPASLGADYVDVTDEVHDSIVKSCVLCAQQFASLTVGFDLITTDPSLPLSQTGGAFNEYNFLPYVDIHEHCNVGTQRPVTQGIWDYIDRHSDQLLTPEFRPF